jgi:NTP pyrophosphatase (non-canonical NTP hydrolase)
MTTDDDAAENGLPWRDEVQMSSARIAVKIAEQRARKHAYWGPASIENRPPDYAGWLPTLVEEVGEVARALTWEEGDRARLRAELIDSAAVCLMWIDSIDRDLLTREDQ